ncbi:MAG TPA: GatB/YqeY domain-containing protein, partial [Candidatus Omnitrophota bacterium]|nr:GatB/YqeY domain-containing protein [Candidatus Omnitrophota bacterium]
MPLEEKILNDFKDAMKQKDSVKVSTLSFLRGQLGYAALEKKKEKLDDADCIAVVKKLIKQ